MHPPAYWYFVSTIAFVCATLALLASGLAFLSIIGRLAPLLGDTRDQIQDLGDLAANTVGSASDTVDLVEARVAQTLAQANEAGRDASRQAMGVGSTLAGAYMVVRTVGVIRTQWAHASRKFRKRRK